MEQKQDSVNVRAALGRYSPPLNRWSRRVSADPVEPDQLSARRGVRREAIWGRRSLELHGVLRVVHQLADRRRCLVREPVWELAYRPISERPP